MSDSSGTRSDEGSPRSGALAGIALLVVAAGLATAAWWVWPDGDDWLNVVPLAVASLLLLGGALTFVVLGCRSFLRTRN